jgi:hypothetical protein
MIRYRRGWIALLALALLTPIGILAIGSAWGEWDLATVKQLVGYTPDGIREAEEKGAEAPFPDYEIPGLGDEGWRSGAGTVISALIGAGLTATAAFGIGRLVKHGRLT